MPEFENYDPVSIVDFCTKSIRAHPKCIRAYRARSAAYVSLEQMERSLADLNEAIRLDPHDPDLYVQRGGAYGDLVKTDLAKADFERAVAICDAAIARDPKNARMFITRSDAYDGLSKFADALADVESAIRIAPSKRIAAIAHCCRAHLLQGRIPDATVGDWEVAIDDLETAIRIYPKGAWMPCESLGRFYAESGEHKKAIEKFTEEIRAAPRWFGAYYLRGDIFRTTGENDRAIADYSEAIRLAPTWPRAYWNRGLAYEKKGEKAKADEDFARARARGYKQPPKSVPAVAPPAVVPGVNEKEIPQRR